MAVVIDEMESRVEADRAPERRGSSSPEQKPQSPSRDQLLAELRHAEQHQARLMAD